MKEIMKEIIKRDNNKFYPFIDELVDSLYTKEINSIIDKEIVQEDKKTFLMFIVMYFVTRLNMFEKINKDSLKYFLSDIIRNPDKRQQCIKIFLKFEESVKLKIFSICLVERF